MKMKKYEVKKVVVPGEYFIEHQYQCHPESFIGVWRKGGQTVHLNSGTEEFICRSCLRWVSPSYLKFQFNLLNVISH